MNTIVVPKEDRVSQAAAGQERATEPMTRLGMPHLPVGRRQVLERLLIGLLIMGVGIAIVVLQVQPLPRPSAPAPLTRMQATGQLTFTSSGSQGSFDQLHLTFTGLVPAAHHSDTAWLLGPGIPGTARPLVLRLGTVQVTAGGHASLLYLGDSTHDNLLALAHEVLVTEDETPMPLVPSPDQRDWRLEAHWDTPSTTPVPLAASSAGLASSMQALFVADPLLGREGATRGALAQLSEAMRSLLGQLADASVQWDHTHEAEPMRMALERVLLTLDGTPRFEQEASPALGPMVQEAAVPGLLNRSDAPHDPPAILNEIAQRLAEIEQEASPQAPPTTLVLAMRTAITQAAFSLEQLHHQILTLLSLFHAARPVLLATVDSQLADLLNQVTQLYTGQAGQRQGIRWLTEPAHLSDLMTFTLHPVTRPGGGQ